MKKNPNNYYLVIGSNSFTGTHFISHLLSKDIQCVGISRSAELDKPFLAHKWRDYKEGLYEYFNYDLNNDLSKIVELVNARRFTHIINFAAQSMVGQSWNSPEDWYQTNIVSLSKLINAIKDFSFIEKYVSITTPEVYGSTEGWIKENFNFNPSTPYAISRAAQDLHLKVYHDTFNFPVLFTRAANVYGPGQSLYRIIPRAIIEALTGGKFKLDGGGKSTRSFIHVEDVCSATLKIAEDGKIGTSYHISGTDSIMIKDLVQQISDLCGVKLEDFVEQGPDRPGKDSAYLLDSSSIREELNWEDKIKLSEGLNQTFDWVKENLEFLNNHTKEYSHKK